METKMYALIQTYDNRGTARSQPEQISADFTELQKALLSRLAEAMAGCKSPQTGCSADEILSAAHKGEGGRYLYSHLDTFDLFTQGSAFTGFTHFERSVRGPKHKTWEIHAIPAWKLDPAPDSPGPLVVIHMEEQSLRGVYSNMQGKSTVVYIDEDPELYDPNPQTDQKRECLMALLQNGLLREIYFDHEGTVDDMDAVLRDHLKLHEEE